MGSGCYWRPPRSGSPVSQRKTAEVPMSTPIEGVLLDNGGAVVNVRHSAFGATGDGTTNDQPAIQAAIDSAPSGALIYLPPGDYRVESPLRLRTGQTLMGAGYSTRLFCPAAGWTLSAEGLGILIVSNAAHVRVTNLRIHGTKSADIDHTPKLIYLETPLGVLNPVKLDGILLDSLWLEHTSYEGIWQGGIKTDCRGIGIHNIWGREIGRDNEYGGLPAIQLNVDEATVSGIRLRDVGIGLSLNGAILSVTNAVITNPSNMGVQTGDSGATPHGPWSLTNITVELSEQESGNARIGIQVDGGNGANRLVDVSGCAVRLLGGANGNAACYLIQNPERVRLTGNTAEVQGRGIGFTFRATAAVTNVVDLDGNTVMVRDESGASYGFHANVNVGSLKVRGSGNRVHGISDARSSYGFYFRETGAGAALVELVDCWQEGGYALFRDVLYGPTTIPVAGRHFSHHTQLAVSDYHQALAIGSLNLPSGPGLAIANDAINLSGTAGQMASRATRITVAPEGGGPNDDLGTISGTQDGDVIIVSPTYPGHTITVRNAVGNIRCGTDFPMSSVYDNIVLRNQGGTLVQLARNDNA